MNFVKKLLPVFVVTSLTAAGITRMAYAEETVKEKAQAEKNTVKRTAKKAEHRIEEKFCAEGDVKCAAEKAKNRLNETKDATKDKAQEVKNKVD